MADVWRQVRRQRQRCCCASDEPPYRKDLVTYEEGSRQRCSTQDSEERMARGTVATQLRDVQVAERGEGKYVAQADFLGHFWGPVSPRGPKGAVRVCT